MPASSKFPNCNSKPSCCGIPAYGYPSACDWKANTDEKPPCGSGAVQECAGNCWDTSLCYLPQPVCEPGDKVVTIAVPETAARLSSDARSALSIYNYSVQRIVSRTAKFIVSYNDWLWQQTATQGFNKIDPPAYISTQIFQTLGWYIQQVDSVSLCNCFCKDMCGVMQLIVGLDTNSTVRNFILDNALNCCGEKKQAGCGKLYEESMLVGLGRDIEGILDLIIHVLRSLDAHDSQERAENLLKKFCRCLLQAAWNGDDNCCPEKTPTNCWWETPDPDSPSASAQRAALQRQQAFAFLVDHIQYLLFDRDCDFKKRR